MSFLAPWALGLAAVAALPAILHLFRRDTRRRLSFPAIRYVRRARDRSARALKLRDRLLLATRLALVTSLALAAAGPLIGSGDVSDHLPTDVILLIDNTGSMNRVAEDTTLLERQRSRGLDLLRAARAGDRFWVLPAVGPPLAVGAPASAASQAVERVEPTDAAGDLVARVREGLRLLSPGRERPLEIVVLSDLQSSSVGPQRFTLPADTRLVVSAIGASTLNGWIADVQAAPPGPGSDGTVYARLESGGSPADTIDVRLSLGGQIVSIGRAAPGGSAILSLPDPGVGEHVLSVEIPPSGLRSDDRRSVILRTLPPPIVRHLGPSDSYVGRALLTLQRAGRLRLVRDRETPAVRFVEGVPSGPLPDATTGYWILAPPEDEGVLARFNAGLERLGVPWTLDVVDAPGMISLAPSPEVPGLESIRVRGRYRLRFVGAGTDTVLIRTSAESPWLVAGHLAGGRYVLMGSPLVPERAELPVSAAMLPFMEAALFQWTGLGGSLPSPVPAGVATTLPAGADSVSAPDGSRMRVDGGSPYVPLRAGVHRVFLSNGEASSIAAVVPSRESDLRTATVTGFARALGSSEAVVARTDAEWRAAMYGSRRGAAVSPYLLALALSLVLLEAALATPARGAAPGRARARGRPR